MPRCRAAEKKIRCLPCLSLWAGMELPKACPCKARGMAPGATPNFVRARLLSDFRIWDFGFAKKPRWTSCLQVVQRGRNREEAENAV